MPPTRALLIALATFTVLGLAGCSGDSESADNSEPEVSNLKGILRVAIDEREAARADLMNGGKLSEHIGEPCDGSAISAGYADVRAGVDVTVRDADGKAVALGRLEEGTRDLAGCDLPFTVSEVPDSVVYSIEVGDRGEQRFTRSELDQQNWRVELGLISD